MTIVHTLGVNVNKVYQGIIEYHLNQTHNQGNAYQDMIRNLYFLDDDLNSDELPFYLAIERLELRKDGPWEERIKTLKRRLKEMNEYNLDDILCNPDKPVQF